MFKKIIAGIASVSLALGMVALTTSPASATPEPKVVVCKYVGTPGVDETLQTTITVNGNALGHDWDGVTFPYPFSDAHDHSVAIGFEGTTATCPAPQGPPPVTTYGVAFYLYQKVDPAQPASWPNSGLQTLIVQDVDNTSAATNNYWTTFPGTLPPEVCGPGWGVQQDKVSFTGTFNFPTNIQYPTDNIGWPPIYDAQHTDLSSFITVPACTVKDAVASVVVSQPDCRVGGSPTFTLVNATWQSVPPTAPGSYTVTAVANSGHAFPGGATTLDVPYTIAGTLDPLSADCYNPKPVKPGFDFIAQCGTYGSINLVDTAYIDYQLVYGDGKQGWNHVVAIAISPYVLKAGATTDWWIPLGVYSDCPEASYEVGTCHADDDESFKNLKVTFDNKSQFPQIYTIPGLGIVEWVPAHSVEVETIQVPTSGSTSYNVYAGLKNVLTIPAIDEFSDCFGVLLTGDPVHEDETCDDGELQGGSIWVDRKVGLKYTIIDVTDEENEEVVETLSGPGEGTVALPPGDYKVTVEALPGYVLNVESPQTSGPWYYTIQAYDGEECDPPTLAPIPTNVTHTDQVCRSGLAGGGTVTVGQILSGDDVGDWFDEVNYYLDGSLVPLVSITTAVSAGHHVVTAVVKAPDSLKDGYPSSFEFTVLAPATCDLTTLALTGAGGNPSGWAGLGYYLLVAGLALIAVRTVRNRNEVKQ